MAVLESVENKVANLLIKALPTIRLEMDVGTVCEKHVCDQEADNIIRSLSRGDFSSLYPQDTEYHFEPTIRKHGLEIRLRFLHTTPCTLVSIRRVRVTSCVFGP